MNMSTRNPSEPIENLALGQIIEVDGSRLVTELSPNLSEHSRVYAGETYPICNGWIVLRITHDADREHVRSILPDSMSGLTKMLSGLRRQEIIFAGQAAMLPARIVIRDLKPEQLPKSNDIDCDCGCDCDKGCQNDATPDAQIEEMVNCRRYQRR